MCGCKKKHLLTPNSMGLTKANPRPDDTGTIALQADPTCTRPYSGAFRRSSLFIVGLGTEHEALFRRNQRNEAIAAARASKATLDQVPAQQVCEDLALALFGA